MPSILFIGLILVLLVVDYIRQAKTLKSYVKYLYFPMVMFAGVLLLFSALQKPFPSYSIFLESLIQKIFPMK